MAPVAKRFTIALAGSTSPIGMGLLASSRMRKRPRSVSRRSLCSSMSFAYSLYV